MAAALGAAAGLVVNGGGIRPPFCIAPPWPVSPDGGGPSLELINLAAGNVAAAAWAPSSGNDGTPRAVNSVELNPPATIANGIAR